MQPSYCCRTTRVARCITLFTDGEQSLRKLRRSELAANGLNGEKVRMGSFSMLTFSREKTPQFRYAFVISGLKSLAKNHCSTGPIFTRVPVSVSCAIITVSRSSAAWLIDWD